MTSSTVNWRTSTFSVTDECVETGWRTASFCGPGQNCVELSWQKASGSANGEQPDCLELAWQKSTFTNPAGNDCVEAAKCSCTRPSETLVRDTKNRSGGTLAFGPEAWAGLLTLAKVE